jgi:DNA-binding GntR family transcriptional regulator
MSKTTQAEEAFREMRRQILILEARPDERLKEELWAERLRVSRPAVREALTRLHGEGLVVKGKKGGYFVAPMTAADVREIREAREIIEVAAVKLAAQRASEAELDAIEETCDDFAGMVCKGYHSAACEADRRFHELLVRASGNSKLIRAYHCCHIPLFHVRLGQSREYMDDYADTEKEHRAIVGCLRKRDGEAAVKTLQAHIGRGETAVLGRHGRG